MSGDGDRFSRVFWVVAGIHITLILGAGLYSVIHRWLNRRPPPEVVTFVSLQTAEPIVEAAPPEPEPAPPTPPPPIPPPPAPEAAPPPARRPVEVSRERVRRPDPPAPQPAPQPQLTPEQIRERLQSSTPRQTPRTAGSPDELSRYHALLHETIYRAWSQPSGVLPGSRAVARIRVQRDGRISQREIIRSSRSSAMDDSILRALEAVSSVSPLPSVLSGSHHDFTIEFELTGVQF